MRIGRVQIEGVSPRFYVIVGLVLVLAVLFVTFRPKSEQTTNLTEPAWPATQLAQKARDDKYLQAEIDTFGLGTPQGIDALRNLTQNLGLPFRARMYLPDRAENKDLRPDLDKTRDGWRFLPAILIPTDQVLSADELAQLATDNLDSEPVMVGFRQGEAPTPGAAYEVVAQLWWRSDYFNPNDTLGPSQDPAPVVLAVSATPLSEPELRAPTTQRANINLSYQEGDYQLDISTIDWSANNELRVCVTVSNTSNRTVAQWAGADGAGVVANTPAGSREGATEPNSALATTDQLTGGQSVSSYITFPAEAANPKDPLELVFPSLSGATGIVKDEANLSVKVPQGSIKEIDKDNQYSAGCGSGVAASKQPDQPSTPDSYGVAP